MNAPENKQQFRLVGTRPVRPDGVEKVTGKAIYGPDHVSPGMLQGAVLRSPHPHARIRGIDTKKAEALAGVKAVVTGQDFPQAADKLVAGAESASNLRWVAQKCMAIGKVFYEGQAVAAVAATSHAVAEAALKLIEVDYEVLPHVIAIEDALAEDAPVLHDDVFTQGLAEKPTKPSNASMRFAIERGDAKAAIAGAAASFTGRFTLQPVHQGYIEPHACVAQWNADGQAQIWCSSQGHFAIRAMTAGILQIDIASVRVHPLEIGGGFGGKTTVYLEPVAMLLSRKAGRPVRLTMKRTDIFRSTGPAPGAVIDITLGAAADGTLVGAEIELKYHGGAFPGANEVYSGVGGAVGHYRVPNASIVGWNVLSNIPTMHAYRAPGAPQINFAVESAMDELAARLGIDPIDLRLKNIVHPGEPSASGVPLGAIGYAEALEAAKAHPHWSSPVAPGQGRGVACGAWGNYGGPSTASVKLGEDGSVLVTEGSPDIGGSRASMAIMAAETLGVAYEKVRVTIADTSSIGFSMVTGGSRTTFATGKAVIQATEGVIEQLKDRAARTWGVDVAAVTWEDGTAVHGDQRLTLAQIAAKTGTTGGPISAEAVVDPHDFLPGFGVHICDTEVDRETGHVLVKRYTVVQDVGRAIHADYVEGQMQGGAVQGIGWALNEAYVYDRSGKLDNAGFLDYRMPVASDMPMIDTVMVEVPNPAHPYGVKGVGEVPIVPPLAAVGNAVSRATGIRMHDLPISPDRVYGLLRAAE
ncbi:xanthine dehydrogenase family protein molybdopterin-binding subunit [Novosphingobium sp. JCM 18896]|uniref:xanthine dehydrogenase family protein molybdopterin-binding subunit n=1 Tax=Novosphingobium sp. JCM 18896 TaxID=2989731 RepID=UPI002221C4AF|nr:xanthine dehydrogenase family protein molybdopterin-binding subunit [Novosphingobium sp. JCM 18896]MCW1428203.1 xanthine dehydrogenase family protein molybdopterin-binding subunit [Novosphingobium sp. JCM 18896]